MSNTLEKIITMNEQTIKTIELTWEHSGPCPDQWYGYFYNEHDNRTYCIYIREDSYWWSANLRSADGYYTSNKFEELPPQAVKWESIELAFDYLSLNTEERYFRKIVEESIIYLNHRFPYFHFDSQERDSFNLMEEIADGDKDSRMEVLSRRAKLMRRYLAEYEKLLTGRAK